MSACLPTRNNHTSRSSSPPRASGIKRPHSPPTLSPNGRRFRIAGADLSASITVFLIAVPMSLGLAVAMDAPLEAGLVSAAIGGIVAGLLGGTPLLVSGPSAGLTVVTAELIQVYGWRTTCAITVGAGLLQILLGSLKAARSALAVSPAIVHGTLAGIGVAIALAQLHIVLGSTPHSSALGNVLALPAQFGGHSSAAPLIGVLTVGVLVLWPRLPGRAGRTVRRIPAALAAVVIATTVAAVATPAITRVDLPSWRSHALPELPHGSVPALATAAFTVMLVASLESLLAAVAVDKLAADRVMERSADEVANQPVGHPVPPVASRSTDRSTDGTTGRSTDTSSGTGTGTGTGEAAADDAGRVPARSAPVAHMRRSDLDRELRGQGIANALAGLLGGLPVSGGAVRSSANVRAGATSRAATVLHGVWVLLAAGLLVTMLEWIPLAALAALVMVVGIQMVNFAHIRNVHKHREFPVYGATITGVILFGVLEGVAIGIAVAVAVALHRLARTQITVSERDGHHLVAIRGQLTFLAVPRLSRILGRLPHGIDAIIELDGFFMDHAAYETIRDWSYSQTALGGRVVFTGRSGGRIAEPAAATHSCCRPWTPWRNHHCHDQPMTTAPNAATAVASFATAVATATAATAATTWTGDHHAANPRAFNADPGVRALHKLNALNSPSLSVNGRPGHDPGSPDTPGAPGTPNSAGDANSTHSLASPSSPSTPRSPGSPGSPHDLGSPHDPGGPDAPDGLAGSGAPATPRSRGRSSPSGGPEGPGDPCEPCSAGDPGNPGGGAPRAVPRLTGAQRLLNGLSSFQRSTAPLVREELARLAAEGQRPSQLFIACADSRLITSMITASGPGDLFTVRNVGNLVPPPNPKSPTDGDDSVAAAIEYAVDVLEVDSITVCGHSGCGAMQALLDATPEDPRTPLWRWLRHGLPSLHRMRSRHHPWARISGRLPTDAVEQLCLTNVVQQLDHLRAHDAVARRLARGTLQLHGMYFHVAEAQAYLLTEGASSGAGLDEVFDRVGPSLVLHSVPVTALDAAPDTTFDAAPDTALGTALGTAPDTVAGN